MQRAKRSAVQVLVLALVFLLGAAAGVGAAKRQKARVSPDDYRGKTPEEAAAALLAKAEQNAAGETWETIAVAQVQYLAGHRDEAERLLASIPKEAPEWIRIGRLYYRAGEWEKAREAFDRVIELEPQDEDWLAEIGMYHNLQGDRARAEELFDRSFALEPEALYNTLKAAGSYVGVEER